jgi:DNA polymerase V
MLSTAIGDNIVHQRLKIRTSLERKPVLLYHHAPNPLKGVQMNSASQPLQNYPQALNCNGLMSDCLQLPIKVLNTFPLSFDLPLFGSKVPAGFPSPADDHLEASIDLNQQYIKNPVATFFVRVQGHSMIGAGIHNNDMLVVDRSLEAKNGSIVIAVVNGELTVKRLLLNDNCVLLMPENPEYEPIEVTDMMGLHIWGVVAHVIHSL